MATNRYNINCRYYHLFYEIFEHKFIRTAFPKGVEDYESIKKSGIWNEHNPDSGAYWADEIFCNKPDPETGTKDRKYLQKQLGKLEVDPKNPDKTGSILAAPVYYALEFLGYKLPADLDFDKILWNERADALFQQFVKRRNNNDQDNLLEVKSLVERFYHCIAAMKLDEAWTCISPTFQNREIWEGSFERFKDGYATTRSITEICAFNMVKVAQNVIKCKIYYKDEVATYPLKGISEVQHLTADEIDVFIAGLNKIRKDIEKNNGKNFGNIPLRKFFDKTSMEFIWYECGFEGKSLHKHFPKPYIEIVDRLFDCSCILIDGRWLINNIDSGVKTYAIR